MRRAVQLFFLAAFSLLFFLVPYSERLPVPADIFLRLDPLLALITCISSRQLHVNLLIALAVIASAFIAGRIFCGYVCPLGTLFDLAGAGGKTEKKYTGKNLKYYLLALLIVSALFGLNLTGLVDPLVFLTRLFTFILYPLTALLGNAGLDAMRPAADYFNFLYLSHAQISQPVFAWAWLTIVLGIALFYFNGRVLRVWCKNLCPLGGLLSLFSRISPVKRQVNDACNRCMKCTHACPMEAIPEEPHTTVLEECIVCARCSNICPKEAIRFGISKQHAGAGEPEARHGVTRRSLVISAGTGALAAFSIKVSPHGKIKNSRLIRPPGAVPEDVFLKQCVRCGECMKACPTNTLQPCLLESGIEGIWTPLLLPRVAGCDQTCSLCGTVCPTGAIRELPLEEKKHAKLGTAYIDRNRCLVWSQDRWCSICDEQCPYNAIIFLWEGGSRKPFVVDNKCNGCGFCEQQCPVKGESAIIITAHNEIRLREGSYSAKAKELIFEFQEDKKDDVYLLQEDVTKQETREIPQLPEGFDKK